MSDISILLRKRIKCVYDKDNMVGNFYLSILFSFYFTFKQINFILSQWNVWNLFPEALKFRGKRDEEYLWVKENIANVLGENIPRNHTGTSICKLLF